MEHYLSALRYCAIYPDIQEKLREEYGNVCGSTDVNSYVTLAHRDQMPYTKAFMEELFRFFSHVPLSIAHSTTRDMLYKGFRIPKDTVVMPNLWLLHHDPSIFPHPHTFDPTRFLDSEGSYDGSRSGFVQAFGLGKRKCVGELLARKELFLLITNTVRRFQIGLEWFEGEGKFDHRPGFVKQHNPAGLTFKKL